MFTMYQELLIGERQIMNQINKIYGLSDSDKCCGGN